MKDFEDASAVLASGVYVLRRSERVVWVGKAKCIAAKVYAHLAGRAGPKVMFGSFQFDSVAVRRCRVDQLDETYFATCLELGWGATQGATVVQLLAASRAIEPLRRRA